MNFPVGKVIAKGGLPDNFQKIASSLVQNKFSGYFILSIKSTYVEEGVLFFREGTFNACIVECLSSKKTLKGKQAVDYLLAQTKAVGYYQVVELSRSQVDLVTAFDEILLIKENISLKDLPKLIPNTFNSMFSAGLAEGDVFAKYGLAGLRR